MRRHIVTCAECAAEVARQHKVAKHVATADPFEQPLSRSWEKLRAQIESDDRIARPQFRARRRFGGYRGSFTLAAASLAACLVAVVMFGPADHNFRTLTSSIPEDLHTVKFQTKPGIGVDEIKAILTRHGLSLVSGPSETGVYTAKSISEADAANLQTVSQALMETPEILFAAPDEQQ
ncbi:hypothetical protein [Rhizobium halophytocola]|uniref:Uncharacterized protein n=1 Tax=Rhizobium halophytocola TaxID=735519 RepID=A0ABS4E3H2_9HYPH|nr:hypothetical protein [Rhizobium halophytocola]MBP1852473.1 hypothetical protein [Rhizobium halophytocola]